MAKQFHTQEAYLAADKTIGRLRLLAQLVSHEQILVRIPVNQAEALTGWIYELATTAQQQVQELAQLASPINQETSESNQ